MNNFSKKILTFLLVISCIQGVFAQVADNSIRGKIYSANDGGLIGVNIVEIDPSNRIVTAAITDVNGDFSMKIKSPKNKLKISYIGYIAQTLALGDKKTFNISMSDATAIKEVVIKAKKLVSTGTFDLPPKQVTMAMQTISAKEFEGLSVASVDDALQGKISGLDVVGNSGDLGSGTSMRIRGISSINSSSEPLIVVNGIIFETPKSSFDFSTANSTNFADLLSVNVDDIESITVLKDAASTAIYGSRGANGVISIATKKGVRGPTKISYTYKLSGAVQPKGMNMLTGDDYTMLMKEAYYNPKQENLSAQMPEFNYSPTFSEYENFNNNTDWMKAVTQYGQTDDHYVQISGGGEKARFLVSAGYYKQTGTIIGQQLDRYSSRMNLDYNVSDRMKFTSEFSFTSTDNQMNYTVDKTVNDGFLNMAYKKMPNMSVYAQDVNGNNTDRYYKMLGDSYLKDQLEIWNPVAVANLAKNETKSLRLIPTFRLQYDLLDPTNQQRLRFNGVVSFDVNNESNYTFYPKELTNGSWTDSNVNKAYNSSKRDQSVYAETSLDWVPKFDNKDHVLMLRADFNMNSSASRNQQISSYGSPNGSIQNSTAGAYVSDFSTGPGEGRSMTYYMTGHYSFKEKYNADITVNRNGGTKFGNDNKWGTFPGISGNWNIIDESFMKSTKSWLSIFKPRLSWGISGNQPKYENLYNSLYNQYSSYLNSPTIRPDNIEISSLRWEKITAWNYGLDLGFFDDKFVLYFDYYNRRTDDMLFENLQISSTSGYSALTYQNGGSMQNKGWELNLNANKVLSIGAFSMDLSFNFSNSVNTILTLEQSVLNSYNTAFDYKNGSYLTRIQENNSFGAIYGFKYKGVYQYSDYVEGRPGTSPFAKDATGALIRDAEGKPLKMVFAAGTPTAYTFKGGDAIYEDVNHDGTINELDMVYLGNSNPLLNGGLNIKLKYKNFSASIFSNFRVGNKIVNTGRMNAENMYGNYNQAASVNWRWRKEGDVTNMPRALNLTGYNWLGSDRYVEDGTFLRIKNLQLGYSVPTKVVKVVRLSQLNFFLTVNNLFVFTKYSGVDPEVGYGSFGVSTDGNQTPRSQSFTASVSASF